MSRVQKLRLFVTQRLNAAVEDILAAFEKTVVKYEQEAALCQEVISRQHALLCALNKPLMEVPSAGTFTQQLQVSNEGAPPEDQDLYEPPHSVEDQEGQQVQALDETDIIQFTYSTKYAARPEPGAAGPDQHVYLVSSETEDSEDYSKDSDSRSAMKQPKPRRGRRPGAGLSCRVCSQTFRAHRVLLRHVRAHLQEAEPACGLCGERFEAADSLKLHLQTHQTETRAGSRTPSRERRLQQQSEPDTHICDDCGKTFLQVWKKTRHRCHRRRKKPGRLDGTARTTRT